MKEDLIIYVLKSSASMAVLYLFYAAFLAREKMFVFNRFYLLASVLFSLVIPLIEIHVKPSAETMIIPLNPTGYQDGYYQIKSIVVENSKIFNAHLITILVYGSITFILLARFTMNIFKIIRIRYGSQKTLWKGIPLALTNQVVPPHSFFSTIFINENDFKNDIISESVLKHEIAHIRQKHTLDILLIELIQIVLWFNPLIILYKRSMRLNHEFLADEDALREVDNHIDYQQVLFQFVFRNRSTYLASNLNYSLTKKRLLMMAKNRLSGTSVFKKIAVLPLFLTVGYFIISAQDPPPPPQPNASEEIMISEPLPPVPPPPPPKDNTRSNEQWWWKIIVKHNLPVRAYNNFGGNIFEMAENNIVEDSMVTLQNAIVIINNPDKYWIIESPLIYHNLNTNLFEMEVALISEYAKDNVEIEAISSFNLRGTIKLEFGINNRISADSLYTISPLVNFKGELIEIESNRK